MKCSWGRHPNTPPSGVQTSLMLAAAAGLNPLAMGSAGAASKGLGGAGRGSWPARCACPEAVCWMPAGVWGQHAGCWSFAAGGDTLPSGRVEHFHMA